MGKHFRSFFAATLISRVFGYTRDLAIAHFIGGGYWADLYYASFRLANLFRRLIGEGGLYAAYTPIYSSLLAKDKESAKDFAHAYAGKLFVILSLLLVLIYIFIKPVTASLLLGYTGDPQRLDWAVRLTAILLPFLAFIVFAAWAQATLQAHGEFFLSSLSPVFASLSIVFFLIFGSSLIPHPSSLLIGLAWATTAGGLIQYLVLLPKLLALIGYHGIRSIWENHSELKKSAALFGPYVFTFSIDQINSFLDTFFGTFAGPGAIAALYNAGRLVQLPVGLVGVGSLVAALPSFSRMVSAADKQKLTEGLRRQQKTVLSICLPAVLIFILGAPWIVRLLYFHGRFDQDALDLTSRVLMAAAPSLIFYSLQKLYLSVFYANQDTRSPMFASGIQLVLSALGCALLLKPLGAVGIALAGSASSLAGVIAMAFLIRKKQYLA